MVITAPQALVRESDGSGQILESAITPWQIAMLQVAGRVVLSMELDRWLIAVESIEHLTVVPIARGWPCNRHSYPANFTWTGGSVDRCAGTWTQFC